MTLPNREYGDEHEKDLSARQLYPDQLGIRTEKKRRGLSGKSGCRV